MTIHPFRLRALANEFLSQYEPVALVFCPLVIAIFLASIIMASVKFMLIPKVTTPFIDSRTQQQVIIHGSQSRNGSNRDTTTWRTIATSLSDDYTTERRENSNSN